MVSYTTTDAENKFWVSGMAAFEIEWALTYEVGVLDKPFRDKVGVTSLPAGKERARRENWEPTLWGSPALQLTAPKPSSSSSSSFANRQNPGPPLTLKRQAERSSTLKFHLR